MVMQVQPVKFTASGPVGAAAFEGAANDALTGGTFQPVGGPATYAIPAQGQQIAGFAYTGFTKVIAYNGIDNSGDVVFVGGGAGVYSWQHPVNCQKGLYVEVTGTGSGTVWLA
jgi:hypothetical protein